MNGYELSRHWFDWCFDNPEKINPNHTALYFFAIEHCNRLGWKEKFGFPTEMAKDAIGIKSYKTYTNTLSDLVDWGFVKMVEKSKNQYSANIVALVNFNKAPAEASTKALSKATQKHRQKQVESNYQSTSESNDSIDKPITLNLETKEPINLEPITTYVELEIPPPPKIDYERLKEFFNANRGNLPELKLFTDARKKKISSLQKTYGKELIQVVIEKARDSDFLQGKTENGWTASFDWIINPTNFIKIAEDNYLNGKNGKSRPKPTSEKSNSEIFTDGMQSGWAKDIRFKL